MKGSKILACVDHTLLSPTATWEEIHKLCSEAIVYKTATICIAPSYVSRVRETFGSLVKICTVIGFPLGYDTTAVKVAAAKDAIKNGADEIDMVINLTDVKNGNFDKITEEISSVKKAIKKKILKVIIETCYLEDTEKVLLCKCVSKANADYIKTSTGFGPAGANHSDIILFKEELSPAVKIKAAGGIRTPSDMKKYLIEGCDRIGASAAVKVLKEKLEEEI